LMAGFATFETLNTSLQKEFAKRCVTELVNAIENDLFPSKEFEKIFGIGLHQGPATELDGMHLGEVVFNAWISVLKYHGVVNADDLTVSLLRGTIKSDFRKWLKMAPSYYTMVLLKRYDEITWWDDDSLNKIAGGQQQSDSSIPTQSNETDEETVFDAKEKILITCCQGQVNHTVICNYIEREITAKQLAQLIARGAEAPIPRLLGLDLCVVRKHDRLMPNILKDNPPAVYAMADPHSGLAGPPWCAPGIGGLGSVDFILSDGRNFGIVDAALLTDYLDKLMDLWGDDRPTSHLNPNAFQKYIRKRQKIVLKDGTSPMTSGFAALIPFDSLDQVHIAWPRVKLHSLKKSANLNDQLGFLQPKFIQERFPVYLDSKPDKPVGVRPENIILLDIHDKPDPSLSLPFT